MHVHPMTLKYYKAMKEERNDELEKYLGYEKGLILKKDIHQIVSEYTSDDQFYPEKIVLLGWNTGHTYGGIKFRNEELAQMVAIYPDKLIGFCQINPNEGIEESIAELEYCIKELKLSGLKLHPILQDFFPNDKKMYPIYEACVAMDIPITFHTGYEGLGTGIPGGDGIHLKYGNPIYIDDVAADFPKLRICMAHPSWPWADIGIAVVQNKKNVFMDISGMRPRYFPDAIKKYLHIKSFVRKVMFGTDYPFFCVSQHINDLKFLRLKPEHINHILYDNAFGFLRL